jgi:hypothetical protein
MDTSLLNNKFERIGARVKFSERFAHSGVSLNIQSDRLGEYFDVAQPQRNAAELQVLDVQPVDRHLLLMVRETDGKHKFLCGHDERHWFVAAIPESAPVGTVRQAKEALKPVDVLQAQSLRGMRAKERNSRKNVAFRRQGEWFFLPEPHLVINQKLVLRNEPLRRNDRGKPHWAEFCCRSGGETVYVSVRYPGGLTFKEYERVIRNNPNAKGWSWSTMSRNANVYVRGRISHADHATIMLHVWHRVVMNTENQAKAMRHVAFLD